MTEPLRLKPGSQADFELLYERVRPRLVRDLTRVFGGNQADAEECVQQAFERAWKAWPDWKPVSDPEAWMARIAMRVALNRRRYDKLRTVPEILRRFGRPAVETDPAALASGSEFLSLLSSLPVRDAHIVLWYYGDGFTIPEIAERIGRSTRTVEARLAAARAKIRTSLETQAGTHEPLRPGTPSSVRES